MKSADALIPRERTCVRSRIGSRTGRGVTLRGRGITLIVFMLASALVAQAQSTIVNPISTDAGGGTNPTTAVSADLPLPLGVASDASGSVYIVDGLLAQVYKLSPSGTLTLVAGNGITGFSGDGGPATSASLGFPEGVAVDGSGNIYIADSGTNRIRRVDALTGIITTVAGSGTSIGFGTGGFSGDGGPATSATLSFPTGVAVDASGNLFVADEGNERIRRVDAATGIITTVAGNGTYCSSPTGPCGDSGLGTSANLSQPQGVAVDSSGNLFIADAGNNRIRRVDGTTGIITTVAGNGTAGYSGDGGPATSASLAFPESVTVDGSGNLFIADDANDRIRRVDAVTGFITTVAGNGTFGFSGDGGAATSASLGNAVGVSVDISGNLFIADPNNHRIRRVDGTTTDISTVAGGGNAGDGGLAISAVLAVPSSAAADASGNLFFVDAGNEVVRRVDASTGIITTVAGNGFYGYSGDGGLAISHQRQLEFPPRRGCGWFRQLLYRGLQ
jgi:sugar lactone lactonase YvrE